MRPLTPLFALLLVIMMVIASTAVGDVTTTDNTLELEDDGGSGSDAPSDPTGAVRLNGPGSYGGSFKGVDSDWYVHQPGATDAACVTSQVGGKRLASAELRLKTSFGTSRVQGTGSELLLGYATTNIQDVYLGLSSDQNRDHKKYIFTDTTHTLAVRSDGGSGADAGATLATAAGLVSGCSGGTMDATNGDTRDVYSFAGNQGDKVVFTLAQSASGDELRLSLLAPDGTTVLTIAPGTPLGHTLTSTGTYYLSVDRVPEVTDPIQPLSFARQGAELAYTTYQIGSCKPHCLIL